VGFNGGDTNLYAYVWNSPSNFRDPLGEWGFGLSGGASAGAGLGAGAVGSVGGGLGLFGGNGLNVGAFGTAGGFAGLGPYGPRYPDPAGSRSGDTGYVLGYGASAGGGAFWTNAKSVCALKGPFRTFTIGGGLLLGGEITIAESGGIYFVSAHVTASPVPFPSGMASLMYTNTEVKPLAGRSCGCNQ
jgi:hypothetical protein